MTFIKKIWQSLFKPVFDFYKLGRYWINLILSPIFAFLSFLYLLNFTLGVVEFIPDFFPIIGHIDEFIASIILLYSTKLFFKLLFKRSTFKPEPEEQKLIENLDIIDIESDIKSDTSKDNPLFENDEILLESKPIEVEEVND